MQHDTADPLSDLENLVGNTINVLAQPSDDPLAGPLGTSPSKSAKETDAADKSTSQGQPHGTAGPLLATDSFVDQDLGSVGKAYGAIGTADDILQGTPLYEDLAVAPSLQPEDPRLDDTPAPQTRPSASEVPDGPYIKVTIKEPEKVETVGSLGIKSHYVQYLVRTDSTMPGLLAEGLEVKRRFSDFDALHKHLKQEYRGYIIPPLPEKSFIQGKMAHDDFIRLRRADLQALKIFLLHPGELTRNPAWTYLVNPPASLKAQQQRGLSASTYTSLDTDSTSGGTAAATANTLKAGLGSWVTWMKASVAGFSPPKRELTEDEVQLRQQRELLQDLEKLLELSVESARSLCAHQEALCADVRELGRTFAMLSRFEEAVQAKVGQYTPQGVSAASRATDLNTLAYGSVKQHSVWKTLSIKTAASLVTLHDYYVLVPEAISALDQRESALTHLHTLQDDLAAKQHAQEQANVQANKLRILSGATAAPSPAEKKAYQLTTAIAQLEEQIKAAQSNYETLKQRNVSELARLGLEREHDFRKMMAHFTQIQADLVRASADLWANLAKQYNEPPPASAQPQQQ